MISLFAIALVGVAGTGVQVLESGAPTKVLVLDFSTANEAEGALVGDLIASTLAKRASLEVMTSADLRRVIDLADDKRTAGCDMNDDSCLAELAGALGAEVIVFGSVGTLGESRLVSVSVHDAGKARALARFTVQVENPGRLKQVLEGRLDRELDLVFPGSREAARGPTLMQWSGGGVAAVGVAGAAVSAIAIGLIEEALDEPSDEHDSQRVAGGLWIAGLVASVAAFGAGGAMMIWGGE